MTDTKSVIWDYRGVGGDFEVGDVPLAFVLREHEAHPNEENHEDDDHL